MIEERKGRQNEKKLKRRAGNGDGGKWKSKKENGRDDNGKGKGRSPIKILVVLQ